VSDLSLRPRRGTEIVDAAFRIYRQHFASLLAISAVGYLPVLVLNVLWALVLPGSFETADDAAAVALGANQAPWMVLLGLMVLTVFWIPVFWASLVFAVSEHYLGRHVDVGTAISTAFSRYGSVTGSTIVKVILYSIGFIFFIIPGIYLYLRYFAVPTTAVIERRLAGEALERSSVLSRGIKMKLFGTMVLAWLLAMIVYIAVLAIAAGLSFVLPTGIGAVVLQVSQPLATILVLPLIVGVETLLYYDARIRQEGYDIEVMSAGLDPVTGAAPAT
jgi:hypothetical protein